MLYKDVVSRFVLKDVCIDRALGDAILENCNGKLFVYASNYASRAKRFEPVRMAAERLARHLRLSFEVKTFKEKFASIYVYYKNGDDEPIPIYRIGDGQSNMEEICASLRNMMYVLSFHPRHTALRHARNEIMRSS